MKFLCKFKVAVFALLVLNLPIWAQPTSLPPLPIPDSLVVKNLNVSAVRNGKVELYHYTYENNKPSYRIATW